MKTIGMCVLVSLAVSCGNPHISSVKNGIERSHPPLAEETCRESEVEVDDYRFFMGEAATTEYLAFVKCKQTTREDFNQHQDATVPRLSNSGRADVPYVLTHRSEREHDQDKVMTIEEIFGSMTYPFLVQKPVVNNGEASSDRGVNSRSIGDSLRDAFVWKFSSPVSFWSAKPVGLKEHVTLRIFNCDEELLDEVEVTGRPKFIGVISAYQNICAVSLSAANGKNSIAIDDFEYGN